MECAIGTGNVGRYDDAIALAERGDLGLPARLAVLAPALKSAGYVRQWCRCASAECTDAAVTAPHGGLEDEESDCPQSLQYCRRRS